MDRMTPSRRDFIRLSVHGALWTAAMGAGLSACAIAPPADGCQYAGSVHSAGSRSVGGRTVICDPNAVDSAERVPHVDDHVLKDETW